MLNTKNGWMLIKEKTGKGKKKVKESKKPKGKKKC